MVLIVLIYVSMLRSVYASDCSVVISLWRNFGRVTNASPNTTQGCCQMPGVECTKESVTKINWSSQDLIGNILPSVGNLSELTNLTLSANSISGIIPDEIGNLKNLEILDLSGNRLSGVIPTTIGQLTKLFRLSLSNNLLSGYIPLSLGNCTQLKSLWLSRNQFNGTIPPNLEVLSQLQNLNLSDNLFSNRISACFINSLSSLTSLDISNNPNLTGAVWPGSDKLQFTIRNTNLTDCSQGNTQNSAACEQMQCDRPSDGQAVSWWIIALTVIVWILILALLGSYIYAERAKRILENDSDHDEKSEAFEEDEEDIGDNESVVTKLHGLRNTTSAPQDYDIGTKRTSKFSFMSKSEAGGAFKVTQPHTPANDDELELEIGEEVKVLEIFEDGWAFGSSLTTSKSGVFPIVCLDTE